jgi:DeoR/GlpR family transcriptional regulator of sugar metabolism
MLANQRREKIFELLREDGSAKVIKLAKIFKVSEVTIRQDLEKLESEGSIHREHGGAFLKNVEDNVKSFTILNQDNLEMKKIIGKKAAELILAGDSIILDSGSTTTEIAKNLIGRSGLTVITNALNIALILGAEPGIEVIVTGGEFKPPTLSLTGRKAATFFEDIHVDKLFLATAGISLRSGLTYPSLSDIVVKKAMIEAADVTYLVADSTKIGKNAFASLGALSLIDYIITDQFINPDHLQLFKDNGIELVIAEEVNNGKT